MSLIGHIASELLLTPEFVGAVSRSASRRYKNYEIDKRDGGKRLIHHPSRELKALQRWMLHTVISSWPIHEAATAYRPHGSIKENISPHLMNRYLLKLDFQDFFPSITAGDLRTFLSTGISDRLGWTDADIKVFLSLVCRHERLTIGAPTSPAISNAVCFELDTRVAQWAAEHDISYTRYADDISLSCNKPNVLKDGAVAVEEILKKLVVPKGLTLNLKKTRNLSKKNRRVVTGLVITDEGTASIGRETKRRIRALIHKFETLSHPERQSLAGLLSHAFDVEPDLLNRLTIKYGQKLVQRARRAGA
jgi:RNA-directed DNA polymerase